MNIRGFLFGLNSSNQNHIFSVLKDLLQEHHYRVRSIEMDGSSLNVAVCDQQRIRKSLIAEITNTPQHPEELIVLFKQNQLAA